MKFRFLLVTFLLAACVSSSDTSVATPSPLTVSGAVPAAPEAAAYTLNQVIIGLSGPLYLTHADDGSGRLFIVEQRGRILIWQDGAVLTEPFLDLIGSVSTFLEQGLLGLAFDPNYETTGNFWLNYTDLNGDTVIARYTVSDGDPNRADPESALTILRVDQPYPNHNGGQLAFGPDGFLYIGLGDGGWFGDPQGNGQKLDTLLGKILRLDVSDPAQTYAIPSNNPFVDRSNARPEIWAYGLRNPWRFSFDRATGDLYIADVGQNEYEEIDFQPAASAGGENYGWNSYEGLHTYNGGLEAGLTFPIAEYSHEEGGCSVSGGFVYRGPALPALSGVYFFGDYCSGKIWALYPSTGGGWERMLMFDTEAGITSFGEDEAGEIYVVDGKGSIFQLAAVP